MFTGIIQQLGTINQLTTQDAGLLLQVSHQFTDLNTGESIAINGVCLTVTHYNDRVVEFFLSSETLAVTTLSSLVIDQTVHLERALCVGDSVGGHWVSGHIDGQLTVKSIVPMGECVEMTWSGIPEHARQWLIPKGSIALNGVSLTINRIQGDEVTAMLIPETLKKTIFSASLVGDLINVEYDMMTKTTAHQVQQYLQAHIKQEIK